MGGKAGVLNWPSFTVFFHFYEVGISVGGSPATVVTRFLVRLASAEACHWDARIARHDLISGEFICETSSDFTGIHPVR